ncbi:MAG: type II toxin-antitoxin system prevent-host-death family antitoxin [Bacteroidetes bacterium]|nr:type II toxin-antitoxin system prevent-host-death family antitoxin [Bacteroidota bacterium]MCH8524566.1 type II toxin-antitoxin system Phd/YefM family antitoxin [Balneolales bacterium]
MKKTVSVTEFKAHCLEIIREVQEEAVSYAITKHNKVVAELNKPAESEKTENKLKNSIIYEGDLISPIEDEWEANA